MNLPCHICEILDKLESAGFEAYVVGGCVRDNFMGLSAHDFDITTAALPHEVCRVFSDCKVIETGLKHGTVTVLYKGVSVEITTFRSDGEYSDGRHPDYVSFTKSICDDLSRRDFTINGIAYSPKRGLVDPFGGIDDIKTKIIRCIGEPVQRFNEDSLRILRGLRFSAVLGFGIEEKTAQTIKELRGTLSRVSKERIFSELTRLLCGMDVRRVMMDFSDVFSCILPPLEVMIGYEQHCIYHNSTVYEHTARAVENAPCEPALRLAMLFHDMGKPLCKIEDMEGAWHFPGHANESMRLADELLREYKASNELRERIVTIVKYHDYPLDLSRKHIRKLLSKVGMDRFCDIMYAHMADDGAKADFCRYRIDVARQAMDIAREIAAENACLNVKDLMISGTDLKEFMRPSPQMGEVLRRLLDEVLEESLKNDREVLLSRAKEIIASI